jgi:hypothetical protein
MPTLAATETGTADLSSDEIETIAQRWVDALWTFYATGEPDLTQLTTPAGLDALRAYDWRYRASESGDLRFLEDPELVDASGRWPWEVLEGEQVTFGVDMTVDVAAYAETRSLPDGAVVETVTGRQRRLANLVFTREPGTEAWLVDHVGSPADPDYVVGLPEPAASRPCPGLRTGRRQADPFLVTPWCTANGEGRVLVYGRDSSAARAPEIYVDREPCGPGSASAYIMYLGTPPGAPIGAYESGDYVRDPEGTLPGTDAFRRRVRPPADAISTGITNGVVTIWTSESLGDSAILVQVGQRFERWPKSVSGCGGPA